MRSVQRKLDAEKLPHREGDEAEGASDGGGARYREVLARKRRDRRHEGDTGKHVDVLGDERETDKGPGDERDVAEAKIERRGFDEARTHDDHDRDEEQEARYHDREQSGPRPAEAANRQAWSLHQKEECNGCKQQAAPDILIDHAFSPNANEPWP